jgi:hypothetical protein
MSSMINRPIRMDQNPLTAGTSSSVRSILPQPRTTLLERFLLSTAIILLPLQDYFPALAGMSVMFLVYGALAAYVIVNRQRTFGEIWYHPVFIAAYAFIVISALLEYSSPLPGYGDIIRFAQMIGGAVCVAVLCRDRLALTAGLYGYMATALWVSIVLFSTGYEALQGMNAEDFQQASKLRSQTFGNKPMGANINGLAFVCAQGAIVAFTLALSDRFKPLRTPLVGITGFCLTASFLPMSRGAAVISLVSFSVILYARGIRQGKTLIFASILGLGIYAVVPDGVWSRMVYSTETRDGKMEARASLYDAALNRLPEYIVAGVGAGNFSQKWGFEKGFAKHRGEDMVVQPTHNSLLQITINWGIIGLVMFLWIIWWVYRSVPLHCGRDELSLALLGITVSVGLFLLVTHGFFAKQLSFAVGMLVGARQMIWSTGIVSAVGINNKP